MYITNIVKKLDEIELRSDISAVQYSFHDILNALLVVQ